MGKWDIKVLLYGQTTVPAAQAVPGLKGVDTVDSVYLGYLLQSSGRNILVDTGVNEKFIIDGKAWAGCPAQAGHAYVEEALKLNGLQPKDIEMVVYTHLHNDHAGNCDLFPQAKHLFQRDEWKNLLDPLPVQQIRRDYDTDITPILMKLDTVKIDGDLEILPGIIVYKTPGHTLGSQIITVDTEIGIRVILGDLINNLCRCFPGRDKYITCYGETLEVDTEPGLVYGPAIPTTIIYDYWSWYDGVYKAKTLAQNRPECLLPGHEPSLVLVEKGWTLGKPVKSKL